jgi:His-Xaa-Ser system radical SAM maturase HxsC
MILSDFTKTEIKKSPFIVRVTSDPHRPLTLRSKEALIINDKKTNDADGFCTYFTAFGSNINKYNGQAVIELPASLAYLSDGDIIAIDSRNKNLRVIYRKNAECNSLMVTAACNNHCLMCSQPPQKIDDVIYYFAHEAIPLMDINSKEIIVTGGEPTLLGFKLIKILQRVKSYLPYTAVHMLSNGRLFKDLSFALSVAKVCLSDFVIGVPLYSDISEEHDYIVQANNAYDETIQGLLNLARCGINVELRIVITQINAAWLFRIAQFIARNLPFACNVAFMGLEPTGFAKNNLSAVWIDPVDYDLQLNEAVQELKLHHIPVSIYNHQLCTLAPGLWNDARQSISDWKNIFLAQCHNCIVRHRCCGFFASGNEIHSKAIQPLTSSK